MFKRIVRRRKPIYLQRSNDEVWFFSTKEKYVCEDIDLFFGYSLFKKFTGLSLRPDEVVKLRFGFDEKDIVVLTKDQKSMVSKFHDIIETQETKGTWQCSKTCCRRCAILKKCEDDCYPMVCQIENEDRGFCEKFVRKGKAKKKRLKIIPF